MADRDNDQERILDQALRRLLQKRVVELAHADAPAADDDSASREALAHLESADLRADMAAVDVPLEQLVARAGLGGRPAGQRAAARRPDGARSWWDTLRQWLWNPAVGYALAAGAMALVLFGHPMTQPPTAAMQTVTLARSPATRSGGGDDGEVQVIALTPDAQLVELRVAQPVTQAVDPALPIRYRARLREGSGPAGTLVCATSDSRDFVPAGDGRVFPVYRVPAHLLRAGASYEVELTPVAADGTVLEAGIVRARFRVAE